MNVNINQTFDDFKASLLVMTHNSDMMIQEVAHFSSIFTCSVSQTELVLASTVTVPPLTYEFQHLLRSYNNSNKKIRDKSSPLKLWRIDQSDMIATSDLFLLFMMMLFIYMDTLSVIIVILVTVVVVDCKSMQVFSSL